MKLIYILFIIYFIGKRVNCNNNDQSKLASDDKPVVTNSQPASTEQPRPESRQINPHTNYHSQYQDPASNINLYMTNLSPKETAHHNPNSPIGYIQIQPVLAPLSSYHQTPETSGSTSFLSIIKPTQTGGRRSSLTNKLKNYFSSFFWKDTSNLVSSPYMTSDSSYSFALKHPPPQFSFQNNQPTGLTSNNYASLASPSQYKPVVFPNTRSYQSIPGSNNFGNKYLSLFNSQYDSGSNSVSNSGSSYSSPYYNSISSNNQVNSYPSAYLNSNSHSKSNNLNSNNKFYSHNTGSYQVAAASNVNSIYAPIGSNSNQYSTNTNNQQEINSNNSYNNQRSSTSEISSPANSKQQASVYNSGVDSSSSSSVVTSSK